MDGNLDTIQWLSLGGLIFGLIEVILHLYQILLDNSTFQQS